MKIHPYRVLVSNWIATSSPSIVSCITVWDRIPTIRIHSDRVGLRRYQTIAGQIPRTREYPESASEAQVVSSHGYVY